jgi:hypothetical protein
LFDEILAPMARHDHQHIAENRRGGFDQDAAKKRGAVAGGKSLERLAALADDEPQREKRA